MSETLFDRFRAWLHELTEPADDDRPEFDLEWLISEAQFRYITIKRTAINEAENQPSDSETVVDVRCDLCGRLFDIEEVEEAIDHVGRHDQQGAANIDPFDEPAQSPIFSEKYR